MTENHVDQLFREFQGTGSPRLLAEIFDIVAPELLLLAGRMVDDPNLAEDLVQATFLELMKSAERFDPDRRLLPWLTGILGNLVRMERRREGRILDTERVPRCRPAEPQKLAEEQEFLAALTAAFEALPEHYRDVLRLALLHGMKPGPIARSLRRPEKTVSTQLRRGLEMLRRALPRGLVLTSLVSAVSGRGLAQLRRTTLGPNAAAVTAGPIAVGASGPGARGLPAAAPGRSILAAVVLACAAAVCWLPPWAAAEADRTDLLPAVAESRSEDPGTGIPAAPREPWLAAAPAVHHGALRLRVEWERTGRPAADIGVGIRPEADPSWLDETWYRTDRHGELRLDDLPAAALRITLDRNLTRTVTVTPGACAELRIAIGRGLTVEGVVVDRDDRPVAGAAVWVVRHRPSLVEGSPVARSDGEGRFRIDDVHGDFCLRAFADGATCSVPVLFRAAPRGAADRRVAARLSLGPPAGGVHGIVLDPHGRPVPGAALFLTTREATLDRAGSNTIRLTSDAAGRFATSSVPTGYDLSLWAGKRGLSLACRELRLAPGEDRWIEVGLGAGARLLGTVRDDLGEPVPGARISAVAEDIAFTDPARFTGPGWSRCEAVTGSDGRYLLDGAPTGAVLLSARAPGHPRAVATLVLAAGQSHTWAPCLAPRTCLRGVLTGEDGAPVAGWRLRLSSAGLPPWQPVEVRSDDHGRFLFTDCGEGPCDLVGIDPSTAPSPELILARGLVPGAGPHRVRIAAGLLPTARLRGRVLDPSGEPLRQGKLTTVFVARDDTAGAALTLPLRIDPGGFTTGPLRPGTYTAALDDRPNGFAILGTRSVGPGGVADFGVHELARPGILELAVLEPGGRRSTTGFVHLFHEDFPGVLSVINLVSGAMHPWPLQPGRYWVARWPDGFAPGWVPFEIRSEAVTRLAMHLERGVEVVLQLPEVDRPQTLRFRWQDRDGTTVSDSWREVGPHTARSRRSTLRPGSYDLRVTDLRGNLARTRLEVATTGERFTLNLPPTCRPLPPRRATPPHPAGSPRRP